MMISRPQKQKRGFTLLETLIAISILAISVAAALGIAQKSLMSSAFSKNQTAAFFLATEGLELVRDVRDNVALYNNTHAAIDWLRPIKVLCGQTLSTNCAFDIDPTVSLTLSAAGNTNVSNALQLCDKDVGCRMQIVSKVTNGQGEIYYASGAAGAGSIFYRRITVTEKCYTDESGITPQNCTTNPTGKREAVVESTVFWLGESFTISETLTNWQ